MKQSRYDCNPDSVIGMQDMNVGVEEILQYCSALLSNQEISQLIRGLERVIGSLDESSQKKQVKVEELTS